MLIHYLSKIIYSLLITYGLIRCYSKHYTYCYILLQLYTYLHYCSYILTAIQSNITAAIYLLALLL